MKKRDNEEIERICYNCEHSTFIENSENCVCSKKGIIRADYVCGKFKVDYLKIVPAPAIPKQ